MQEPDLVWKFSHQCEQPPPMQHNANPAAHLLENLGHVYLPQASTQ